MGILIRPIVTEKASSASELENRYSFEVKTNANKVQIKKAVEDFYGVNVEKVRTLIYKPNHKTKYTKSGVIKEERDRVLITVFFFSSIFFINFFSKL